MTLRNNPKRDRGERQIIDALRSAGCLVKQLDIIDLLVLTPGGTLAMLEVKYGRSPLTPAQERLVGEGWPIHVCRSVSEALRCVGYGSCATQGCEALLRPTRRRGRPRVYCTLCHPASTIASDTNRTREEGIT